MCSNSGGGPVKNWPYLEDILYIPEGMLYHPQVLVSSCYLTGGKLGVRLRNVLSIIAGFFLDPLPVKGYSFSFYLAEPFSISS